MLKRLAASLVLSGAIVAVTMIGQIVAVPIYLASWGAEQYGEWLTLTNLLTSLSILNLGVQSHVSNRLITCFVGKHFAEGTRLLHAALRLYIAASGIALVLVLTLCIWPGLLVLIGIKAMPASDARIIAGLQGALAIYAIVGGLLLSLFRVTRQLPRQLSYALIERVVFLGVPCCAAFLGSGPVRATAISALTIAILAVVEMRDVRRHTPFPIGIRDSTWQASFSLISPSFLFLAVSLSAQMLSTGIVLIVSTSAGAVKVAIFSATLMLTNFVRVIIGQGLNIFWPEITSAAAAGEYSDRLIRWHRLIWKLAFGLALLSAAGICLIGDDVVAIWTRGRIAPDSTLNLLLSLYLVVQTPSLVAATFGLAMGRQKDVFRIQFLTATASILVAICLAPIEKASGAAYALILCQLAGTMYMTRAICGWTRDELSVLIRTSFARALPAALFILFLLAGTKFYLPGLTARLLISAALIPAFLAAAWQTWLTPTERDFLRFRLIPQRRQGVPA